MGTKVITARNVNESLRILREMAPEADPLNWRKISPRGMETIEYKGTVITEYLKPRERVLFSPERDANPFFHFFESLWILAGRNDVAFLKQFVSTIDRYSDYGRAFRGAYGVRLRRHFGYDDWSRVDQLAQVIQLLKCEPDTRRAVLSLWDPAHDLNIESKDIPCNDLIMLKMRDNKLDITVCCRSNDAIWGAYGANAVQFSMIQEFIASSIGAEVGVYRQVSDSFHIYTDNEAWKRLNTRIIKCDEWEEPWDEGLPDIIDYYALANISPFPLFNGGWSGDQWLNLLDQFMVWTNEAQPCGDEYWCQEPFFYDVARPLYIAHYEWKKGNQNGAMNCLSQCKAVDWRCACHEWFKRRMK